jgi:hypothetical protein
MPGAAPEIKAAVKDANRYMKANPCRFEIKARDLTAAAVTGEAVYNGTNRKLSFKLSGSIDGRTVKLKAGKDFEAAGYDGTSEKTEIRGINNFTGNLNITVRMK